MVWIIFACTFAYLVIASVILGATYQRGFKNCLRRYGHWESCGHPWAASWGSALWPLALPIVIGLSIGRAGEIRKNRAQRRLTERREEELAEARHQAQLATLKAQEHRALDFELELLAREQQRQERQRRGRTI